MADPAFLQKMVMEQTMAVCSSLWYEYQVRAGKDGGLGTRKPGQIG